MTRIYNHLLDETADLLPNQYITNTNKKYFGKITVAENENSTTHKLFYTVCSKEDLFDNAPQKRRLCDEITTIIEKFFKKYNVFDQSKILLVGLGNEKITADSLGCRVVDKLTVTSHIYNSLPVRAKYGNLCAIKCGVSGLTGIESFDIISSAIKSTKPDMVIAVDTLACGKTERLGCTIQLSDNGIEPGGGVNNAKRKLTEDSLSVPVLAIGVPFVIYAKTILSEHGVTDIDKNLTELVVTAKEIDFLVEDYSEIIARAVNRAVHKREE